MALTKQQRERLQRTQFWENAVANMSTFEIPEGYEAAGKTDKYERFTGYLKEWIINLLVSPDNYSETYDKDHPDKTEFMRTIYGQFNINKSQKDTLWQEAIEVGSGKKNIFDTYDNYTTLLTPLKLDDTEHLKPVYDMFIPTYHAIKEKFEKRWWFEWIFNHKQYVAERDSLKAMDGIFREITGYGKLNTEEKLSDFRNELKEMRAINNEEINNVNSLQNQNVHNIIVDEVNQNENELVTGKVEANDLEKDNLLDKSSYI
jgi:hypothetical protein